MQNYLTPARLRLAAYVAAAAFGIWQVVTGAAEAEGLAQLVSDVDAQLGLILAVVGGLAGRYVDRSDGPPVVLEVDTESMADAVTERVKTDLGIAVDPRAKAEDLLAAMRARIDAARGGREPAPARHRAEG